MPPTHFSIYLICLTKICVAFRLFLVDFPKPALIWDEDPSSSDSVARCNWNLFLPLKSKTLECLSSSYLPFRLPQHSERDKVRTEAGKIHAWPVAPWQHPGRSSSPIAVPQLCWWIQEMPFPYNAQFQKRTRIRYLLVFESFKTIKHPGSLSLCYNLQQYIHDDMGAIISWTLRKEHYLQA